jgi:hypothetical protein
VPEVSSGPPGGTAVGLAAATLRASGSQVSITAISPPEQGDALSGLTLAIGGVGPASAEHLPAADWPTDVHDADAWAAALGSETGWYVLLSQDGDIVRDAAHEPTVLIAPLVLVSQQEWNDLSRNGYSARRWAYPGSKFSGAPDGKGLAVDLAWTTSILKGSLGADVVTVVRPLTGPNKRSFSEWLAARTGRAPFPDDVVTDVLNPCYETRSRLSSRYDKAAAPGSAPLAARAVAVVERWFAHHDGRLVTFLGQLTGPRLEAAGFRDPDTGDVLEDDLVRATHQLETEVLRRMNRVNPHSGYSIKIMMADLANLRADQFLSFSLLLR